MVGLVSLAMEPATLPAGLGPSGGRPSRPRGSSAWSGGTASSGLSHDVYFIQTLGRTPRVEVQRVTLPRPHTRSAVPEINGPNSLARARVPGASTGRLREPFAVGCSLRHLCDILAKQRTARHLLPPRPGPCPADRPSHVCFTEAEGRTPCTGGGSGRPPGRRVAWSPAAGRAWRCHRALRLLSPPAELPTDRCPCPQVQRVPRAGRLGLPPPAPDFAALQTGDTRARDAGRVGGTRPSGAGLGAGASRSSRLHTEHCLAPVSIPGSRL